MHVPDGQGTAFRQVAIHWELARMLSRLRQAAGSRPRRSRPR
jgi:hypothetical protein